MSTHHYLFYDIESTGLNPCFDQVLQFAAIRTDSQFNEVDRHEIRIKLNPDIIPAPMAVLTHKQGVALMQQGVSEYEGIMQIHALMNAPNTISLGYNTLGFDDEFLRFSFYRNLLNPYSHQYANNCYRMDVYPIAVLYKLFKPGVLNWPEVDGRPSMKLEAINAANQLASGMAHDAIVDVEVTVELAKRLREDASMWDYCAGYFHKKTDTERMNRLNQYLECGEQRYPLAYLIQGKLGSKNQYIAPVIGLGAHQVYKNQTLWLRLDLDTLDHTTPASIKDTFVIKKKVGEQQIIVPYHDRYERLIGPDRQAQIACNITWCQSHASLLRDMQIYHQQFTFDVINNVDADAALYQLPFSSAGQLKAMRAFHTAMPKDKFKQVQALQGSAYYELALRILCKHFPDYIDVPQQDCLADQIACVFSPDRAPPIDFKGQHKASAKDVLAQIETILFDQSLPPSDQQLLHDLRASIQDRQSLLTSNI